MLDNEYFYIFLLLVGFMIVVGYVCIIYLLV